MSVVQAADDGRAASPPATAVLSCRAADSYTAPTAHAPIGFVPLGGYTNTDQETTRVFDNGSQITDPSHYVFKAHDNIVVAFGAPSSFPTQPSDNALNGL